MDNHSTFNSGDGVPSPVPGATASDVAATGMSPALLLLPTCRRDMTPS
jgi:hypothetical protein